MCFDWKQQQQKKSFLSTCIQQISVCTDHSCELLMFTTSSLVSCVVIIEHGERRAFCISNTQFMHIQCFLMYDIETPHQFHNPFNYRLVFFPRCCSWTFGQHEKISNKKLLFVSTRFAVWLLVVKKKKYCWVDSIWVKILISKLINEIPYVMCWTLFFYFVFICLLLKLLVLEFISITLIDFAIDPVQANPFFQQSKMSGNLIKWDNSQIDAFSPR